jgi:hypothetical protein
MNKNYEENDFMSAYTDLIALPNRYFDDEDSFLHFWRALKAYASSSRSLPEQVLESLQNAAESGVPIGYAVTDWYYVLKDAECRTIRNLLETSDFTGQYPKQSKSKTYDMVRLISLSLQYEDYQYAKHVKEWCSSHIDTDIL